jgi:hypothetical protein
MNEQQKYTGGTDYDAIVADLDKPIGAVRPKGNPNKSHAIGATRAPLHILTGNGHNAHLYPSKRYVEAAITETEARKAKGPPKDVYLERRVNIDSKNGYKP